MQCDLWFPTPIWSTELDIDNQKIYDFCKKRQSKDLGRELSNYKGWQSTDIYPHEHNVLNELTKNIFECTATALDGYKYDTKNRSLNFLNMWININDSKDAYNKSHIHAGATISGVYYVKCNENSGKICFPRNFQEEYIIETFGDMTEGTTLNHTVAKYSPQEAKLILFPGWIPHYVENSIDDSERISLAFNIGFN